MADTQYTTIQALSKVIDTTQSGYAPRGLPAQRAIDSSAQSLSLQVLNVTNNQVLLQAQASGEKILLDKNTLQNTVNAKLVVGDRLLLVTSNQQAATFVLEKNGLGFEQKLSGPALQNVATSLATQWQDLPTSIIKKSKPLVLNQVQIASNTLQAGNLAKAIVAIVNATGQPSINVNANAQALFLKNPAQSLAAQVVEPANAELLRLNINIGKRQPFALDLPLNSKIPGAVSSTLARELTSLLSGLPKVSLQFDTNNENKFLSKLMLSESPQASLSKQAIAELNVVLQSQVKQIKQAISSIVVSPHSPNLHKGIVLDVTTQNLTALGASIKQHLVQGVKPEALHKAIILVTQNQNNTNQIQVSLTAKPVTITIKNTYLSGLQDVPAAGKVSAPILFKSADHNQLNNKANHASATTTNTVDNIVSTVASQQIKEALHSYLVAKGNSELSIPSKIIELQSVIYRELNQVLPRAESTTVALPSLLKHLNTISAGAKGDLQQLFNHVIKQVTTNMPASETKDATLLVPTGSDTELRLSSQTSQQIKELFASPALASLSSGPVNGVAAISNQGGLVNGLVTMLQASLQAKLLSQQPQLLNSLLQSTQLSQILPALQAKGKAQTNHSKLIQDLSKLDPKGSLIAEINKVLSNHSLHKLSSAESSLQQQDSFYYVLPNMFSSLHKDIEILIKREREAHSEQSQQSQLAWQLSMKLDVGKAGEVLAKVKLANDNVDLNLYASNEALKEKILTFLPLLDKRLTSLGFSVSPKCFLGKIPDTLFKTDYQVVQAYV